MKNASYIIAALGTAICLTGCGKVASVPAAQTESTVPAVSVTEITSVTATTSNVTATTSSTSLSVTSAMTVTDVSSVTVTAEKTVSEQNAAPADNKNNVQNLPVINTAELIAEYNDCGDGYMYRLEALGDYEYWNAEFKGISASQEYSFSVSSRDLNDDYPYVTGGSTITELSAVVTPYDSNGNAGTPVTVVWDRNRTVHEAERIFGSVHDTANMFGFYPYSEAAKELAGNVRVKDIEGQWLHGQYTLYIFGCDKVSGLFTDQDENGSYAGTVYLEYSINGNYINFWYNLYNDDGSLFKSFKVGESLPVNELYDERNEGFIHSRIS